MTPIKYTEKIGDFVIKEISVFGKIIFLLLVSVQQIFYRPFRRKEYFRHLEFIGNQSILLVLLTGFTVGAILTLQLTLTLSQFRSESLVGGVVALIMAKEMGPLLAALMINGRVASAIAAEIGTMRVTEQIDALEVMSVNAVQYLISPRLVAGICMLPCMTMIVNMTAMIASYVVAVPLMKIDQAIFFSRIETFVPVSTLMGGLFKSAVFGFLLTFIGCYKGYFARNGAKGVGQATTQAVVIGSVLILIADYFIGAFFQ